MRQKQVIKKQTALERKKREFEQKNSSVEQRLVKKIIMNKFTTM